MSGTSYDTFSALSKNISFAFSTSILYGFTTTSSILSGTFSIVVSRDKLSPDTVNFSEVLLVVVFCLLLLALHPVKHILKAMAHKHKAKAFFVLKQNITYPPYTIFVYVITRAYGNIISISTLYFWHFWYVFWLFW